MSMPPGIKFVYLQIKQIIGTYLKEKMCPAYLQPSCQHHIEAPQQKAGSRRLPANRFSNMLLGALTSPPWARDQTAACILRQWFLPREGHWQSNPDLHPLPPHHQTLCLEDISWGQISNWFQHLERSLVHSDEKKEQEPCWCEEKPLALHHHGGCQCQCTARESDVSEAEYKDVKMTIPQYFSSMSFCTTSRMAKTMSLT